MADFTLPNLGEDIDEADVLRVLVSEGDTIAVDQPVIEIETEKATLDVPSSVAGRVTRIHVNPGDVIKVGQVLLSIESGAAAEAPAAEAPAPEPAAAAPPAPEPEPEPASEPEAAAPEAAPAEAAAPAEPAPAAEPEEEPAAAPAAPPAAAAPPPPPPASGDSPVFAAPSVRRFAREIGIDIAEVPGSGPGGRISEDDVKQYARERSLAVERAAATAPAPEAAREPRRELPDFAQWGEITREPLSRLRRTVARNLSQSWEEIPHVHLYHHADITAMEELRQQYKERARAAGGNLTISVMLLKIVAAALKAHPKMNSSLDLESGELILKRYIHIGMAVDTERGLVVPKIENVDQKNIIDLSIELNDIAQRARDNKLSVDEMRGSSFTVSNLGSLGTGYFDPIINWPEVGVLGLGRAERVPVWNEQRETWEPRLRMPMSIGFDHRVIDGADGARFMTWIVEAIKNPLLMALEG